MSLHYLIYIRNGVFIVSEKDKTVQLFKFVFSDYESSLSQHMSCTNKWSLLLLCQFHWRSQFLFLSFAKAKSWSTQFYICLNCCTFKIIAHTNLPFYRIFLQDISTITIAMLNVLSSNRLISFLKRLKCLRCLNLTVLPREIVLILMYFSQKVQQFMYIITVGLVWCH